MQLSQKAIVKSDVMASEFVILPWYTLAYTCRGCCVPSTAVVAQQYIGHNQVSPFVHHAQTHQPKASHAGSTPQLLMEHNIIVLQGISKKPTNSHTSRANKVLSSLSLRWQLFPLPSGNLLPPEDLPHSHALWLLEYHLSTCNPDWLG